MLGDVTKPHPVRRLSGEQAFHEVIMRRRQGLPTAAFALVKHPTDPSGPHESCDAFSPAGHSPLHGEVGVNPWGTIGSPRTPMRPLNQLKQLRILDRPGGGFPSHPVIKPGTRDPHNPARHRHRKPWAAISWTNRNAILGGYSPWRNTRTRVSGSRFPSPTHGSSDAVQ